MLECLECVGGATCETWQGHLPGDVSGPQSPSSVYHHSGMRGGTREGWNDTTQPSLGYLLCLLFQLRHYQRMQIARSGAGISPRPRQSAPKAALMGGGGGDGGGGCGAVDKVDRGSVGDELGGRE